MQSCFALSPKLPHASPQISHRNAIICSSEPQQRRRRRPQRPPKKASALSNAIDDLTMKKYGRGYIFYGERKRLSEPEEPEQIPENELLKPDAVLVAGGTGRTGQWVTLGLLNQGFNVRVLTRKFERAEKLFGTSGANVDVFEGKLSDEKALADAVGGASAVVCVAGDARPWWGIPGVADRDDADGEGAARLVRAAAAAGVNRFVLVSDADGNSARGRRKAVAEDVLKASGLPFIIVRAAALADEEGGLRDIRLTPATGETTATVGSVSRVDLAQTVCQAMVHHRTIEELKETDPEGGFVFPDCTIKVCNGDGDFVPEGRFWRERFNTIADAFVAKQSDAEAHGAKHEGKSL